MVKQFFCKIDSVIDEGYKVILNSDNITLLPSTKLTIRRIFTSMKFNEGDLLYVDSCELKEGGKLYAQSAYLLKRATESNSTNLSYEVGSGEPIPLNISDATKQDIVDSDTHPILVFKQLCGLKL